MNKTIITSIIIAVIIIGGSMIFSSPKSENQPVIIPDNNTSTSTTSVNINTSNNITIENGVQIIELKTKGGYSPRKSVAQAGLPTIIRFKTTSTFDCSLSLRIPSINYSQILPQTGQTDVSIGTSTLGIFRGSCSMGMYPFEINFK